MNDGPQGRGANFIREVGVGLSVLGVLFSVFVGAAYQRFSGPTVPTPAAISSIKQAIVGKQPSKASVPSEEPIYRTAGLPGQFPTPPNGPTPASIVGTSPVEVPSRLTDEENVPATTYIPNLDSLDLDGQAPLDANQGALPAVLDSSGARFETTSETENLPSGDFSPTPADLEPLDVPGAEVPFGMEAPSEGSQVVELLPIPEHAHQIPNELEANQSHRQDVIHPNDSFWKISLRAYGTGEYFRALYEANRTVFPNPDELPAGAMVIVPKLSELQSRHPKLCSNKTVALVSAQQPTTNPTPKASCERIYVAQQGDTLFDIARFELGQAARYVEILQLNRGTLDANQERVPAGARLRLPLD